MLRTFVLSCDLFNGYTVSIDMDYCANLEEIIEAVRRDLIASLDDNDFDILIQRAREKKYHIHDLSYEDIINNKRLENEVIYICSHVDKEETMNPEPEEEKSE